MPLRAHVRSFTLASVAALLATSVSGAALAYDKRSCATAYETAQHLRLQLKLRRAREQLAICAHSTCPAVVSPDCAAWLKEVDAAMPSVVIRLRDERGRNVAATKVWVDGEYVLDDISSPIVIDPGLHTIRVDADGFVPVEQKLLLRTGDRNSSLEATVTPIVEQVAAKATPEAKVEVRVVADPAPARRPAGEAQRTTLPAEANMATAAIYVTGAAGLLSLASFSYFALAGTREAKELRDTCAPNCAKEDVDSARTKLVVANVSLGVGLGAVAVAGILWFTRGASPPKPASAWNSLRIDVGPTALGSGAQVLTTFTAP